MPKVRSLAISLLVLAASCGPPVRKHWEEALRLDTVEAYEEFLRRYPESPFAEEAKRRLRELRAEDAYRRAMALKEVPDSLEEAARSFREYLSYDSTSARAREAERYLWLLESWLSQDERWRRYGIALSGIGDVKGAVFDPETKYLTLWGDPPDGTHPPLALDDLMLALEVARRGEFPKVSIEPEGGLKPFSSALFAETPKFFTVRFDPPYLRDTHFGYLLFLADRRLKALAMGVDPETKEPVLPEVPGYLSIPDRAKGMRFVATYFAAPIFKPKKVLIREEVKMEGLSALFVMNFERIAIGVDSQSGQVPAEEFARQLEEHFYEYADLYPSLRGLVRAVKLLAVGRWVKDVEMELSEVPDVGKFRPRGYRFYRYPTPTSVPTVTVEISRERRRIGAVIEENAYGISGGVLLSTPNTYIKGPPGRSVSTPAWSLPKLRELIRKLEKVRKPVRWEVLVKGRTYRAASVPLR